MFGTPFYQQSFGHGDRLFLDFILTNHPEYKNIVEFGTFRGWTSMYLGLTSRLRNANNLNDNNKFHTFDIVDHRPVNVKNSWLDNMVFNLANLEEIPLDNKVISAVRNSNFLFSDGGSKRIETILYANLLKKGSGIFVHDYVTDNDNFKEKRPIFTELINMGYVAKYEIAARFLNSCGRFWVRENDNNNFDLNKWLTAIGCESTTICNVRNKWFKYMEEQSNIRVNPLNLL